jgi:hypothetical protein
VNKHEEYAPGIEFQAIELLNKRIEAADTAARKLQEATREANGTLKAVEEARKLLDRERAAVVASVTERVGELIDGITRDELGKLGRITEEQMHKSVLKVSSEFDKLEKILLGEEPGDGGKSIRQYISDMERSFQFSYEKFTEFLAGAASLNLGCTAPDCEEELRWALKVIITLPDGRKGEMHTHMCVRHYKATVDDPEIRIIKKFDLAGGSICPWQHPPVKQSMVFDEEDQRWYPAQKTLTADKSQKGTQR